MARFAMLIVLAACPCVAAQSVGFMAVKESDGGTDDKQPINTPEQMRQYNRVKNVQPKRYHPNVENNQANAKIAEDTFGLADGVVFESETDRKAREKKNGWKPFPHSSSSLVAVKSSDGGANDKYPPGIIKNTPEQMRQYNRVKNVQPDRYHPNVDNHNANVDIAESTFGMADGVVFESETDRKAREKKNGFKPLPHSSSSLVAVKASDGGANDKYPPGIIKNTPEQMRQYNRVKNVQPDRYHPNVDNHNANVDIAESTFGMADGVVFESETDRKAREKKNGFKPLPH